MFARRDADFVACQAVPCAVQERDVGVLKCQSGPEERKKGERGCCLCATATDQLQEDEGGRARIPFSLLSMAQLVPWMHVNNGPDGGARRREGGRLGHARWRVSRRACTLSIKRAPREGPLTAKLDKPGPPFFLSLPPSHLPFTATPSKAFAQEEPSI